MTVDDRTVDEIVVLADIIFRVEAEITAQRSRPTPAQRADILAIAIMELVASARAARGLHSGRLYAATVLDELNDAPESETDQPTAIDLLIPVFIAQVMAGPGHPDDA
ncbi:hypothetical protein [Nocardia sp. NPDC057353]|uniref:hypothetical protein n=1 Tax=Nocardia sp. NPDC057353 TaxID=3346104 RepID=UPI0036452C5F